MRNDITPEQVANCQKEFYDVVVGSIDSKKMQEAYDSFREKTGGKVVSISMNVVNLLMPTDRYIGESQAILGPIIEFEENLTEESLKCT